ncbi:aminoglycoside phosphotransferase family protein [Jannaschia sp. CCS1]|uniref:aminoglycoside phosphotransferase family protein n=1 Tax=Jannaschia sp. (strain CCS1) TaxID=290400 RepID=UPI000053CFA5|nr:phosphotransferase [Jannaschia sp. CCS1]ABD56980.1 aminoglycoside phosphotransferase [Jannaschia sp. CCS1]
MSIAPFLEAAGWAEATATPLAGDASSRRYTRLSRGAETAVLMQAPVATKADHASFDAFRKIGAHLRGQNLSAPKEYAADPTNGLILMEDLGDQTLARLLKDDAQTAQIAYNATANLLPHLKVHAPPHLAAPDARAMAQMVALTFDQLPDSAILRDTLLEALAEALTTHAPGAPTLSLRDVHAENLLWLPDRDGPARVGLLDFQDALLLPEGYDLASLLDDPRREVPEVWRADLIAAHSAPTRIAVLSLQRNLRILGIFRRLSTTLGKPAYGAFLPRTRTLIARAASDLPPMLAPVTELLDRTAHWTAP